VDLGPVGAFALTERSGRTVRQTDLLGKVWVASFVFTRCSGPCPQVSSTMQRLQEKLAGEPGVLLVTFTVDPEYDQPAELSEYARHFQADPERWLFLTGKQEEIYRLLREGFHVPVAQNEGPERIPGQEVMHSPRLAVVDGQGRLRGYFDGVRDSRWPDADAEFENNFRRLRAKVVALAHENDTPPYAVYFPPLNAALNAASVVLILLGYVAVRGKWIPLHKASMLSALALSAVFLGCYLFYHLGLKQGRPTRFEDQAPTAPDWMRQVYLGVLLSHTVLAIVAAPLALFTAYQGLRDRVQRHVRIARWTLPIWLYVSITGVVVYAMLYQLYPPP
jgi:protein SCO1/2/putative membrane protein